MWNDPDKGLHLMVPVMKQIVERTGDETLVQVRIKKTVRRGEGREGGRRGGSCSLAHHCRVMQRCHGQTSLSRCPTSIALVVSD